MIAKILNSIVTPNLEDSEATINASYTKMIFQLAPRRFAHDLFCRTLIAEGWNSVAKVLDLCKPQWDIQVEWKTDDVKVSLFIHALNAVFENIKNKPEHEKDEVPYKKFSLLLKHACKERKAGKLLFLFI